MENIIQEQMRKLLDDKFIHPLIPPHYVWIEDKKKDASSQKKYRMVILYRRLNAKEIENIYPLPRIEDISDNQGICYYLIIDMAKELHQIEMDEKSIRENLINRE